MIRRSSLVEAGQPFPVDRCAGPRGTETRVRCCVPVVAAIAVVLGLASPARAVDAPDVAIRTSLDRTAVWVADRVVYTIELACRPGVDVLDEDLSRDKLKLEGLQIVSGESAQETSADGGITHRYTYTLTTYRADVPQLRIEPLAVRYYVKRPGQRLQDAAPAGEAQIPGASVAFRSTLPDQQETAALRDRRPAAPRLALYSLAQPVGLGLVIASFAPALFWAAAVVQRRRRRVVHRSVRQVRSEERASIDSVHALDLTSDEGRREAYTRIDAVVRDHLREIWGVPGPSLTPAELAPALGARATRVAPESIAALLAECEQARYAPPSALPSAEACREALAQAEQLVAAR